MSGLDIEIDDGGALGLLIAKVEALGSGDRNQEIHETIGNAWGDLARLGFQDSADPYGNPWAPPARDYGHPLLVDTLDLVTSFLMTPTSDGVTLAYTDSKAAWHHYGTETIPARPLLPTEAGGLPELWIQVAAEETSAYLHKFLEL
jgi:hypothetical protein